MEKIAKRELVSALHGHDKDYPISGPCVGESTKTYISFFWFHELEWGDSAKIFVKVHKSLFTSAWRDYRWPSITMNYQWTYLELNLGNHRLGHFKDVLSQKNIVYPIGDYSLLKNHPVNFDSSQLILVPERIFFFLKEGYFETLKKEENRTIVAFHEPIGKMNIKTSLKIDTSLTSGAKIYINDSAQILIVPCRIPNNLWK
ncbi:MAG: hypothetical protein M0P66_15525 [Salinivirgaceae bacterium]|nr:hypothetical protein [Salinivirgaceae bacterium]